MAYPVSPAIIGIQPPPITEVKGWLAAMPSSPDRPLIDLCQAVPDYPPASELLAEMGRALQSADISRYTPDEGLASVRESVSAWYGRRYGAAPKADEMILTIGASQAFWLAMTTLCRAGDEVIVQAPAYFDHPMALAAFGVKPVFAPFVPERQGLPDPVELERLITPRTRALLLVTPSNPTGAVLPPVMVRQLFELAQRHNLALILDETYNAFVEGAPHTLFSDPAWRDSFVHIASFGKTFALTGFRAGALIAGEKLIREALKIQDSMAVCQPRLTQLAVQYGCDHLDPWVAGQSAMMARRSDQFNRAFRHPELRFSLAASGSFFAWVQHPWLHLDSRQAARRLVEARLICLPGAAFGPGLDSYLRLAIGNISEEQIPAVIERLLIA